MRSILTMVLALAALTAIPAAAAYLVGVGDPDPICAADALPPFPGAHQECPPAAPHALLAAE